MTKPKRFGRVLEFKKLNTGGRETIWEDDADVTFSGEITGIISYLQGILEEGYTHVETETERYMDYGSSYARSSTKYYKLRPENDEEYKARCAVYRKNNEAVKAKAAAREAALKALTPEQAKALGL